MSGSTRILTLLATIAVAACAVDEPSVPERSAAALAAEHAAASPARATPTPAEVNKQLAQLRQLTARYHNIEMAIADGYDAKPLTNCWEKPGMGAMGYHFVKGKFMDKKVDLFEPEVLMYEPGPSGHMRLVGLEYIVEKEKWEGKELPMLLGQKFTEHNSLPIYKLHIWLWQDNPSVVDPDIPGMFNDWNPRVSCKHTTDVEYF